MANDKLLMEIFLKDKDSIDWIWLLGSFKRGFKIVKPKRFLIDVAFYFIQKVREMKLMKKAK